MLALGAQLGRQHVAESRGGLACLRANQFHIFGTFVGVLFMQTIQTGLIIMNYSAYLANIIQGTILIVAVLLSRVGSRSP